MLYQFNYITKHSLNECLDCMLHDNINDVFYYSWEKKDKCYLITFNDFKNSSFFSLKMAPKPIFQVKLNNSEGKTCIDVTFIGNEKKRSPYLLSYFFPKILFLYSYQIDNFFGKKLDATRIG